MTAPAACAGVVAVIEVLLATLTLVAEIPPRLTIAPLTKLAPLMVTDVPPAVGPELGETALRVGAGEGGAPVFGRIVVSFFKAPGEPFK